MFDVSINSELGLQQIESLLCCICIFAAIATCLWNGLATFQQGVAYVKKLHQIPCDRCAFFTGDYRLKCTVRPFSALTEDAIDCNDYEPRTTPIEPCMKPCNKSCKSIPFIAEVGNGK